MSRSERGEGAGGGVREVEIPRLFNVVYDMLLSRVGIIKVGSHNFLRLFCIFVKFVTIFAIVSYKLWGHKRVVKRVVKRAHGGEK